MRNRKYIKRIYDVDYRSIPSKGVVRYCNGQLYVNDVPVEFKPTKKVNKKKK